MIPKGWVGKSNLHKLTKAEAVAFVYFMLCEKRRHERDIQNIRDAITDVREYFEIEGLELNAIYSGVYGAKQSSGVTC